MSAPDQSMTLPPGADIVHGGGGRRITKRGVPLVVYFALATGMLVGFGLVDSFKGHVAVLVTAAVLYFVARDATEDDPDWPTVAAARAHVRGWRGFVPGVSVVYERRRP